MFVHAVKQEAKLRLAIAGPSGSGKTYTALAIASRMGKKIALVDTEHGSASKYADLFSFDVMEMEPPYSPNRFAAAIREAQTAGYDVLILDSMSHIWNGTGGLLEEVDKIARAKYQGNSFAAWKDATPIYNNLVDTIIQSGIHVIATMRTKQDYVIVTDDKGKSKPQKVGLAPIQRDGFEYEFDIVLNMDLENSGIVSKTRCADLNGKIFDKPGKEFADIVITWLAGAPKVEGVDPLSDKAVKFAADTWNISIKEARESIKAVLDAGRTFASKADFKAFVEDPQGQPA